MKFFSKSKRFVATLLVVIMVAMLLGGVSIFAAGGRGKGNGNGGGRYNQSLNQKQAQSQTSTGCLFVECQAFIGEGCDIAQNNCTCPYSDNQTRCVRQKTGTPQMNNPDCPLISDDKVNNNTNPTSFNQSNPICPDCGDKLFVGSLSQSGAKRNQKAVCENGYKCKEHIDNMTFKATYRSSNCPYYFETEIVLSERNCRRF